MFETVRLHTRMGADGHLHVDLPLDLPPDSEVEVTVSMGVANSFEDDAAWQNHISEVVGSFPEIERPEQPPLRPIEAF